MLAVEYQIKPKLRQFHENKANDNKQNRKDTIDTNNYVYKYLMKLSDYLASNQLGGLPNELNSLL